MGNNVENWFNQLNDDQLRELNDKLLAFADFRLSFNDTQGLSAEDFVQRAIAKAISGRRVWNTEQTPKFENFLKGCISSEINNHFNLKSTRKTSTASDRETNGDFFDCIGGKADILTELEGQELRDQMFDELVEYDEQLAELLFFQEEGYKPSEIVEKLNYESVQDVYNARKRLRRRCRTFLSNLETYSHE